MIKFGIADSVASSSVAASVVPPPATSATPTTGKRTRGADYTLTQMAIGGANFDRIWKVRLHRVYSRQTGPLVQGPSF